ncbi:helix-turn-helix domain-containing protein [Streptomyces griseoviridis]
METATRLGSVGQRLAKEVARVRGRTSVRELSARLAKLGRPILPSGITKIEQGKRRVDVDDLVALSLALKVTPTRLLLGPPPTDGTAEDPAHDEVWEEDNYVTQDGRHVPTWWIRLAPNMAFEPWDAWTWAAGESPAGEVWRIVDGETVDFPEGEEERFKAENQLPPLRSYFGTTEDVKTAMWGLTTAVEAALAQGLTDEQIGQAVKRAAADWRREQAVRDKNQERYRQFPAGRDNEE